MADPWMGLVMLEAEGEVCSHHKDLSAELPGAAHPFPWSCELTVQERNSLSYAAAGLEGKMPSPGANTTDSQDLEST